jgi:hypothetical protein
VYDKGVLSNVHLQHAGQFEEIAKSYNVSLLLLHKVKIDVQMNFWAPKM